MKPDKRQANHHVLATTKPHHSEWVFTMKTTTKLLALASILAATALPASSALAVTEVERTVRSLTTQVNTCNEETVLMSGTATRVRHDDGTGQVTVHLTGTGDLGNTYVLNQRSTFQFNIRTVDAILVSQGAAPNQDVSIFFDSDVPIRITSTNCTPTP